MSTKINGKTAEIAISTAGLNSTFVVQDKTVIA